MSSFVERIIGAAKLDPNTYEDVESDSTATTQAMIVVVVSALAGGIGAFADNGGKGFFSMTLATLLGWYAWAFTTWLIGTKLLPESQTRSDVGELLRTTGFSASPGILRVFGGIPVLGPLINFGTALWMLAAMAIAVKHALDYTTTRRAVAVCLLGFLAYLVVVIGFAVFLGISLSTLGGKAANG